MANITINISSYTQLLTFLSTLVSFTDNKAYGANELVKVGTLGADTYFLPYAAAVAVGNRKLPGLGYRLS